MWRLSVALERYRDRLCYPSRLLFVNVIGGVATRMQRCRGGLSWPRYWAGSLVFAGTALTAGVGACDTVLAAGVVAADTALAGEVVAADTALAAAGTALAAEVVAARTALAAADTALAAEVVAADTALAAAGTALAAEVVAPGVLALLAALLLALLVFLGLLVFLVLSVVVALVILLILFWGLLSRSVRLGPMMPCSKLLVIRGLDFLRQPGSRLLATGPYLARFAAISALPGL